MIRRLALCCLLFQSTAFSQTFQEYCEQVDKLSVDQRRIVHQVLDATLATCAKAEEALYEKGDLTLYVRGLRDISLLSSLPGIRDLSFIDSEIADISTLAKLKNLESLYLGFSNNVSDIKALEGLTKLKDLQLPGNLIKDITPLRNLVKIERLLLEGNPIQDFSSLANMVNLTELRVGEQNYDNTSSCPATARSAESTAAAESLEKILKNFPKLTGFVARGINLKSLAALEAHPDLQYVIVECASIEDIRPFAAWPKLNSLVLAHNRISRIDTPTTPREMGHVNLAGNFLDNADFLNKISDVHVLNLSGNRLTGEFKLPSLPSLSKLDVSDNQIKYIDLDDDYPELWDIDVSNNALAYIQFSNKYRKIQVLDASDNRLVSPAAGVNFDEISGIYLQNNRIVDYSFVNDIKYSESRMPRVLDLGGNPGRDFSVISHPSITMFYAEGSHLSKVSELPDLPLLEHLNIARNSFTNLDGLGKKYRALVSLKASDNPLSHLESDHETMFLSRLDLSRTKIRSFKFLEKQSMVYNLKLSGNRIVDLSPLKELRNLQEVDLSHNKIEDLSPLTEIMTRLHTLDLSDNKILDATPLGQHKKLNTPDSLILGQNPLGTTVAKTPKNCPTQSASPALNAWCSQK